MHRKEINMAEVTRVITIQATRIIRDDEVLPTREETKDYYQERVSPDADQVLVTVQGFIREEE